MCLEQADRRHAYASLDEMLSQDSLSEILGRRVASVGRDAFEPPGFSSTGAAFEAVYLDGDKKSSLIAKTIVRDRDWVAIATHDRVDREVWTWESGLLDRLPAPAGHAVLAGARSGTSYSILMSDMSDHLLPDENEISVPPAQQTLVLEALAALHAEFWMDDCLDDDAGGLSTFGHQISHGAPSTMRRVQEQVGTPGIAEWIAEGWDRLPGVIDPGMAADIRAVAQDPLPVVEAARRYPRTLAHTDPRPANLAIDAGAGTVVFLDWARPAPAPPAYDLLYWLYSGSGRLAGRPDGFIDVYAAALERRLGSRFSGDWWSGQLELGFVAFLASFAGIMARDAADRLGWWVERARPGLRALG